MSFFDVNTEQDNDKSDFSLWVEKYRPDKIQYYLGNETFKKDLNKFIKEQDIKHILLCGSPGIGKTTAAKLIVKNIECDYIIINASDENGIDIIRTKVKNFASTVGFKKLKIIIFEESDGISPEAQDSLKSIIETYSKHTRFIFTCNHVEKIIPALLSRFDTYKLKSPEKKDIAIHLAKILRDEKVQFKVEDVGLIVDSYYPDIRSIIKFAQRSTFDNKLEIDNSEIISSEVKFKFIEFLKTANKDSFKQIRQFFADNKIKDFSEFYSISYQKIDEYAKDKIGEIILILAESQYKEKFVVDKEINFMACVYQIINEISK